MGATRSGTGRLSPTRLCLERALWLLALGLAWACQNDVQVGADELLGAGGGVTKPDAAAGAGGGSAGPCEEIRCKGKLYGCGDCRDNDGDGLVDADDPECLGACDNTEDSFHPGLPGQDSAACLLDCFFDHDRGSGNDDCFWSHRCDPLSVAPDYPPGGMECPYDPDTAVGSGMRTCDDLTEQQSSKCEDKCLPVTPNGCDCFGCCELPARGGRFVWIGSTQGGVGSCDLQRLDDPDSCRPCTPVNSCFNPCTGCEACVGERAPAADCGGDGGPRPQCPDPLRACGQTGQSSCADDEYCVTGCCASLPE